MAKDFSTAVKEIMPLVGEADTSKPFIISRNKDDGWQISYPFPAEDSAAVLADQRKLDPCALMFTGVVFSKGSFPYVYDKLLCHRLRAEFDADLASGDYPVWAERKEVIAMLYFFEDKISEFSHMLTDYLTTLDKPLVAFAKMCPYNMVTDNDDWLFNEDLAFNAIHYIENEVKVILQNIPQTEIKPKPRVIDGCAFIETQSVQIGKISIVFAECADAPSPFLICNRESEEDYDHSAFPGYLSAMREFTARQTTLVSALEAEREIRGQHGVDSTVLAAEHCLPESNNGDFTGKTLIVKASELSPEFRYADSQLIVCSHGSGARSGNNGRTVYGTELYTGGIVCYGRYQIEGVADETQLPEWAKMKLEIMRDKEIFEYGGYHFKPVRQFRKKEVDRPLEGDSRPWKRDAQYAMLNMSSDFSLGISSYDWKKTETAYSYDEFYAVSGDSNADIFRCVENGKLYVPGGNELFLYKEPQRNK